jgi:choice-of-anchor C domain-containing protein
MRVCNSAMFTLTMSSRRRTSSDLYNSGDTGLRLCVRISRRIARLTNEVPMHSILRSAALVATLVVGASTMAHANLVTNGGFEDGSPQPAIGGFTTLNAGSGALSGWTIDGGSIDWINGYWQAAAGTHSIDLDGLARGAVSQVINTTIGATYKLSFSYAGNPDHGGYVHDMLVDIRGDGDASGIYSSSFNFDTTGRTHIDMGWTASGDVIFVADSTTTRLSFESLSTNACCWGVALDDIVVEQVGGPGGAENAPVSAPAGLPLLIGAIGGLAYLRRRTH